MTPHSAVNPENLMKPTGPWAHGVMIPAGRELLAITGQVPIDPAGRVPEAVEDQAELVWANLLSVLDHAGMSKENIVRTGVYVTSADSLPIVNTVRSRILKGMHPTTTALVVLGLADPRYLIEIDALAAR